MGFRYFTYFHSLVPVFDLWFRVVTKLVSEQWFHYWSLNYRFVFSYTTAVLGCQMSVMSSLILVFCVVSISLLCFNFIWFVFSTWEGEHEMLPLLKQLMMLSSPFRMKLLLLLLNVQKRDSSGRGVLSQVVFAYARFFLWICWLDFMLLWLLEMSRIILWVFIRGWLIVIYLALIKFK